MLLRLAVIIMVVHLDPPSLWIHVLMPYSSASSIPSQLNRSRTSVSFLDTTDTSLVPVTAPAPATAPQSPFKLDDAVSDTQRDMLLRETGIGPNNYALTLHHPFNASLQGLSLATLSDLPDEHSDILPSIPLLPPAITIAEPLPPPPPGHTWWHLDTGATGSYTNQPLHLLAPLWYCYCRRHLYNQGHGFCYSL